MFTKSIISWVLNVINKFWIVTKKYRKSEPVCKHNYWQFCGSSNKVIYGRKKVEFVTTQCGFKRVVSDSINILENRSSIKDLIFTLQPNLVINWGSHSSLHSNCHHQITHAKFNWKHSIHLHMNELSDTIKMQIMIFFNTPYPYSTGKELFLSWNNDSRKKYQIYLKKWLVSN